MELRVPAEDHHHRRLCQAIDMGGRLAGVETRSMHACAALHGHPAVSFACLHTASHRGVVAEMSDATHTIVHAQVGNETVDQLSWTRPEDITTPRSFYYNKLALNGASDLNGQIVGALASTAAVFKTKQPSLYDKYMNVALPLYGMAIGAHSTDSLRPLPLRRAVPTAQEHRPNSVAKPARNWCQPAADMFWVLDICARCLLQGSTRTTTCRT